MHRWAILAAMTVTVAGCDSLSKGPYAAAQLDAANGSVVWGRVTFHQSEGKAFLASENYSAPVAQALVSDTAGKVFIRADVNGLPSNRNFVISLHEHGDCASSGALVGNVFNPDPIPRLASDGEGHGSYSFTSESFTVAPGPRSVVNRAVVIRERTQELLPTASSTPGPIIACGVIKSMD